MIKFFFSLMVFLIVFSINIKGQESTNYDYELAKEYATKFDKDKTLYHLQRAAEQGFPAAQNDMGSLYYNAINLYGFKRDYLKAFEYFSKAAQQDYIPGIFNLACCYKEGVGVELDSEKALGLFQKTVQLGTDKNLSTEKRLLYKPYVAEAELHIGFLYEKGWGVSQNWNLAHDWYKLAAEAGNDQAQTNYGCIFYNGSGNFKKDYTTAFEWFSKAAKQGNTQAERLLGYMYMYAMGCPEDYEKAYYWCLKAAEKKDPEAMNNLGFLFMNGWGVDLDYKKALYWYNQASGCEIGIAYNNLGYMYEKGLGVDIDLNTALDYYEKAVNSGYDGSKDAIKTIKYQLNSQERKYEKAVDPIITNLKDKRVALLIGNEDYSGEKVSSLVSPKNDVVDLSEKLKTLGFKNYVVRTNLNRSDMRKTIHNFCDSIKSYDVVLFYYSGHAIQYNGSTLLLTTGSNIDYESDYNENSVSFNWVLNELKLTGINTKIIVMDACRNNSSGDKGIEDEDLVKQTNTGCFLAYAARAGEKAKDGLKGQQRNSAFTKVLLDYIDAPLSINGIFEKVTLEVEKMTKYTQKPRYYNDLFGQYRSFSFKGMNVK